MRKIALLLFSVLAMLIIGVLPAFASELSATLTDMDVIQPVSLDQETVAESTTYYHYLEAANDPGSCSRTFFQFEVPSDSTVTISSRCTSYYAYYFVYDAQGNGVSDYMSYANGSGQNVFTKELTLAVGTYLYLPAVSEAGQITFTIAAGGKTADPTVSPSQASAGASSQSSAATQGAGENAAAAFVLVSIVFIIFMAVLGVMANRRKIERYEKTTYYSQTGKRYSVLRGDTGAKGEYLLGELLSAAYPDAKLAFNAYIPKSGGTYSEVDVLMVTAKAIYVFESKNYSGWIFGNERDAQWTQTFRGGTKNRFYNPIRQNAAHILALADALGMKADCFVSIIVFGNECTLKDVTVESGAPVIYAGAVRSTVMAIEASRPDCFSTEMQEKIFEKLESFTDANESMRASHIDDVCRAAGKIE